MNLMAGIRKIFLYAGDIKGQNNGLYYAEHPGKLATRNRPASPVSSSGENEHFC
jgi:hypothetical protein